VKAGLNFDDIRDLKFIKPPITLQKQFTAIVKKVKGIKSHYQQSLDDLGNLYAALSQTAFKGELDLSRIPLSTESTKAPEEENHDTSKQKKTTDTFDLPAPSDLTTLNSTEGRNTLLDQWLSVWLEHLNDAPFTTQPFIEAAQQRLSALAKDDALEWEWGASEYDQIKAWMFESLAKGHLAQTYDDANNRVQIKARGN